MYQLSLNNQKVFDFYKNNPTLDFEQVCLLCVQLFENVLLNVTNVANEQNSMTSMILTECLKNGHKLNEVHSNVEKHNSNILNEIKKEYLQEVKKIMNETIKENNTIKETIFEQNNNNLVRQIKDILPKNIEIEEFTKDDKQEQLLNVFENKINSLLINIIQQYSKQENSQTKIFASIEEFLDRYRNNSSAKGKFAENHLKNILEENIENSEIIDKSTTPHSCDMLLQRTNKPNILIENKIYNSKVPTLEVDKFRDDCRREKTHGIILSQFSKITLKENYQIDIIDDKFILVYVSDVKDEFYKIQSAINIIDLVDKYTNTNTIFEQNNTNYTISKEIIMDINQEVNSIHTQKEIIINMVKEFHKKLLFSIEDIKCPSLNKYLQDTLAIYTPTNNNILCNKCKNFQAKSKVSLAAHQKSKLCLATFHKLQESS